MAPGVTSIRRVCGRKRRTRRIRVEVGIAHHEEAAVVPPVIMSLEELVVEPWKLLQSVSIDVAIARHWSGLFTGHKN